MVVVIVVAEATIVEEDEEGAEAVEVMIRLERKRN